MSQPVLTYLALGDSYTIGESVAVYDKFPYQLVQHLRKRGLLFSAPEIVARTGWTVEELESGTNQTQLLDRYDLVTLLIGVNNQYRGLAIEAYATEFENILQRSIALAGGNKKHVVVVSIPDWGVTPFAKDRNREQIAKEIDLFNRTNRDITERYGVHYVDITPGSREALHDPELVAGDGLHPSGKEYAKWVRSIATYLDSLNWK